MTTGMYCNIHILEIMCRSAFKSTLSYPSSQVCPISCNFTGGKSDQTRMLEEIPRSGSDSLPLLLSLAGRSMQSRSTGLLSRPLDGARQLLRGILGLSEPMPRQVSWLTVLQLLRGILGLSEPMPRQVSTVSILNNRRTDRQIDRQEPGRRQKGRMTGRQNGWTTERQTQTYREARQQMTDKLTDRKTDRS